MAVEHQGNTREYWRRIASTYSFWPADFFGWVPVWPLR